MPNPIMLHSGFDGLDISYQTHVPRKLLDVLGLAKLEAAATRQKTSVTYAGHSMLVSESGSRGGYTYTVDTGVLGATWFFKENKSSADTWGVRVSSKSLPLALNGAEHVKRQHDAFLTDLGCAWHPTGCRVSRIDYAIDFLLPEFEIEPDLFICHSRKTKSWSEKEIIGNSNKITGIRIGKMPGAQVVVYDKKKEVLDKKKKEWWEVWENNSGIKFNKQSPIWRFEFRLGKNTISRHCPLRLWGDAPQWAPTGLIQTANECRLVQPGTDTNRSRWPSSALWQTCQAELAKLVFEKTQEPELTKRIMDLLKAERMEGLDRQALGLLLTSAAGNGCDFEKLPEFIDYTRHQHLEALENDPDEMKKRLAQKSDIWGTLFPKNC
ncbi:MAG: hypothetical protein COA85_13460 [Robiginitomaculum sp.]|nr:MAG: hypothetical protein COA85_13460 [Robiginitomaculum sp.]